MKEDRNYAFDNLKGFLIILVVVGHAVQCTYRSTDMNVWLNPVFNIIYTFHMPLFIFVSGFFFKSSLKRDGVEVLRGKFNRLILPTVIYSVVIILLYVLITNDTHPRLKFIFLTICTYWYLICVFTLTLIYWFFFKGSRKIKCAMVVVYLLSLLFYDYLPPYILKNCQIIRQTFIFGFGAYLSIYCSEKVNNITYNARWLGIVLILTIGASLIRVFYGFNMMCFPPIIRITDGFVCSMLVFNLVYPLLRVVSNKSILRWLAYIGRNSLAIYLVHVVFSKVCLFLGIHIEYTLSNVFLLSLFWLLFSLMYILVVKWAFKEKSYILGV